MSVLFPTYARWEVAVKEGKGTTIIDVNGKSYLDFTSGIAVCNLGHCHEKVNQALKDQVDKVWHVSNLFQIEAQERVASILTEYSSGEYVFFCNSGAEANEAAIKLARKHTGKYKILSFQQSFHGRTLGSMSATGQDKVHQGFGPLLQDFKYLPYNDLDAVKDAITDEIAAVMIEVIQGEGGVRIGNEDFIKGVASLCEEHGVLLIVDEVQTGIGRTGKPFGYQHYGISPDIICVAKGLGNGFPVGGIIGKGHLKEAFSPGSHGSTFGGNFLAMAAAEATINEIFNPTFLAEVEEKGNYFKDLLAEKLKNVPSVQSIQGKGLMIGVTFDQEVAPMLKDLRDNGLLALVAGPNVLRLVPPLIVTKEEIEKAVELIVEQCEKL
ncbi:acetylornithine transaminase [Bacillus sp. FJAT-45350]|uniref:acetylornithine transaminase n=1 Tax=Bacillus sp. FJAT-45350 TaxID=2011014 RepID=UPI000BB707A2|nr:acetylornithine transaminase [Bacillus sp. FJAT-45350]